MKRAFKRFHRGSSRFSLASYDQPRDFLESPIDPPGSRAIKEARTCRRTDRGLAASRRAHVTSLLHTWAKDKTARRDNRGGGGRSKSTDREALLSVGTDYPRGERRWRRIRRSDGDESGGGARGGPVERERGGTGGRTTPGACYFGPEARHARRRQAPRALHEGDHGWWCLVHRNQSTPRRFHCSLRCSIALARLPPSVREATGYTYRYPFAVTNVRDYIKGIILN